MSTDRPTDRVELTVASPQQDRRQRARKGNDSLAPASARRVSSIQLSRLSAQLSARDHQILHSLRYLRLLAVADIQRLHFDDHASAETAQRTARKVMARLEGRNLVRRLRRRVGGIRAGSAGYVYALTPLGHRLLGTPTRKRWHEPSPAFVEHTLMISCLGAAVIAAATDNAWGYHVQVEPDCWRTLPSGQTLKPDLFVHLRDRDRQLAWFIEADRSSEHIARLRTKHQLYQQHLASGSEAETLGFHPRTLWVTDTAERAARIVALHDEQAITSGLFDAVPEPDALTHLLAPFTNQTGTSP